MTLQWKMAWWKNILRENELRHGRDGLMNMTVSFYDFFHENGENIVNDVIFVILSKTLK